MPTLPPGSGLSPKLRDEIEKTIVEHSECDILEVVYMVENLLATEISLAVTAERERLISIFEDIVVVEAIKQEDGTTIPKRMLYYDDVESALTPTQEKL